MKKNSEVFIKFVRTRETSAGVVTSFSVGEKVKDGEGYVNYNVTVWGSVGTALQDGDKVKIAEIESFQVRPYKDKNGNDRLSYDVTVKLSGDSEEPAKAPSKTEPNNQPAFVPPADDDTSLPFDL